MDSIPPSIQILSPADEETLTANTIIDVNAYDNESIHRVEFYIRKSYPICFGCPDSLVFTDFETSSHFYWDIYNFECGTYSLIAIAYDNSNNSTSVSNRYYLDQVINILCDITTTTFSEESLQLTEFLDQKWVLDCLYKNY